MDTTMTKGDLVAGTLNHALYEFMYQLRAKSLESHFEPEIYMTREFYNDLRSSSLFGDWNQLPPDADKHSFQGCAVHLVYDDDAFRDFRIVAVFK